jgi:transcriptional regulator with XRE-family HTH domain
VFVRYVAAERNWTIKDLALETGISRSAVQRWLSGESRPDTDTAKQFAAKLGLDQMEVLRAAGHLGGEGREDDWEIDMIRASGLPEPVIDRLVREAYERRAADRAEEERRREARRRDLERQIETLHDALKG